MAWGARNAALVGQRHFGELDGHVKMCVGPPFLAVAGDYRTVTLSGALPRRSRLHAFARTFGVASDFAKYVMMILSAPAHETGLET